MTMITIAKAGMAVAVVGLLVAVAPCRAGEQATREELEKVADSYRAAYLAHDRSAAPIAPHVRYTENNVEMPFPDGTWDTVTDEVGPVLTIADPAMGAIGIYMAIHQRDVPGFLAVRLKVKSGKITEIEHVISTKRNLSSPPTPIGEVDNFHFEAMVDQAVPADKQVAREKLIAHANGYFDTLQLNDGKIRGTCFHDDAVRLENGLTFKDIKAGFESGFYAFNNRVRREIVLVDEKRQIVMARGFIDHKGVLDEYSLTDGKKVKSIFREPQSWGMLEMFKVTDGCIASVVATFYQAPYFTVSPWTPKDRR